jgi:N-acetylmuramoyl-L-alanine amidase
MSDPKRDDTPASVVFMEMMRQAAASQQPVEVGTMAPPEAPVVDDGDHDNNENERQHETALQAERIRRVEQRKVRRRERTVGVIGGLFRSLLVVLISGALIATILSWWTSPDSFDDQLRAELGQVQDQPQAAALVPTYIPTPNWLRRIGIVSGHRGPENDPGAVCDDGLTESEVNFGVAQLVVLELRQRGYTVDLLEEFDDEISEYKAAALVSIHANTCKDYGEFVSGYLVGAHESRPPNGEDARLVECVAEDYGMVTGLERRYTLTRDMEDYHVFREIDITTPGAIIEIGFMKDDRELLTQRPDIVARGIIDGIICFLEPDDDGILSEATPRPTLTPPTNG